MAGGCALNCTANGKLLRSGLFDDIWIQPASGDAGCALGAAMAVNYHAMGRPRAAGNADSQKSSLLGPSYTPSEIKSALEKYGAKFTKPGGLNRLAAKMLAEGKIVARFAGRAEFGPRALGNRSILADPRSPQMQKKLNLAVKKRESFRPFAPSCLEEDAPLLFDLDRPSPYMLLCAPVAQSALIPADEAEKKLSGLERLSARRSKLPAVTHVDGSARIVNKALFIIRVNQNRSFADGYRSIVENRYSITNIHFAIYLYIIAYIYCVCAGYFTQKSYFTPLSVCIVKYNASV